MEHILKLRPKYYECIKKRSKVIELRLLDEKRQKIKIGDTIIFKKEPELEESLKAEVKGLLLYPNFKSIVEDYPIEKMADNETTKEELIEALNTFYSAEQQAEYGVVGIRIEVVEE